MLAGAVASTPAGRKLLGAAGVALLAVLVVMALMIAGMVATSETEQQTASFSASSAAVDGIPPAYMQLYLQAGQSRGIDWAILAAIGYVETKHGESNRPGWTNSYGCCAGPMQFCVIDGCPGNGARQLSLAAAQSGTWRGYRVDGDGDGTYDPWDPRDAIPAAADLLKANGAPGDYRRAVGAYNNNAAWYIAEVLAKADEYRGALKSGGSPALVVAAQGAQDVLRFASGPAPRIRLLPSHRDDLRTGQIDVRITSLLAAIAERGHSITISSLKSDHSLLTSSKNVSNHSVGRAVDISVVDGEACASDRHGRSGRCWALGRELAQIRGQMHPSELIYGIDLDGPGPAFACTGAASCGGDHRDHIHAGQDS